jgi:hypothetical protein
VGQAVFLYVSQKYLEWCKEVSGNIVSSIITVSIQGDIGTGKVVFLCRNQFYKYLKWCKEVSGYIISSVGPLSI